MKVYGTTASFTTFFPKIESPVPVTPDNSITTITQSHV